VFKNRKGGEHVFVSECQAREGIERFNELQRLPEVRGVDVVSLHENNEWEPHMDALHYISDVSDSNEIEDEAFKTTDENAAELSAIHNELEELDALNEQGGLIFNTNLEESIPRNKNVYEEKKSKLVPEYEFNFNGTGPGSSARAFFAFVPLSFWQTVVLQNINAKKNERLGRKLRDFQLRELIQFIGLLLHFKVRPKGSFREHWDNPYDAVMGGDTSLFKNNGKIMKLSRFIQLRRCFCIVFKMEMAEYEEESDSEDHDEGFDKCIDPLWRVRPLLNIVKKHSAAFVIPGTNVCIDEASVAARSKFANFLIFYNPNKPCGKYHFKFYMLACSDQWYMLNFIVHCNSSEVHRLEEFASRETILQMQMECSSLNRTCKIVMELMRSLYGSNRILNTDNYYTSIQLASALKTKQIFLRGTVRKNSKYIPHALLIEKNENSSFNRGHTVIGFNMSLGLTFYSWNDGNPVNLIGNVDGTEMASVWRRQGSVREKIQAPLAVKEYNKCMQGVDRHDQMRSYAAMAGGHSFKAWYKKFSLCVLDFAIVNAFTATKMVQKNRALSYNDFIQGLTLDLIHARYANDAYVTSCIPLAYRKLVPEMANVVQTSSASSAQGIFSPELKRHVKTNSPSIVQIGMQCRNVVQTVNKKACIVCLFELGRRCYANVVIDDIHHVPLCLTKNTHPPSWPISQICDPYKERSCWDKYHFNYLDKELWITKKKNGKWTTQVRTANDLWKARSELFKASGVKVQSNGRILERDLLEYKEK
jgi:Transposase IS4